MNKYQFLANQALEYFGYNASFYKKVKEIKNDGETITYTWFDGREWSFTYSEYEPPKRRSKISKESQVYKQLGFETQQEYEQLKLL